MHASLRMVIGGNNLINFNKTGHHLLQSGLKCLPNSCTQTGFVLRAS